MASSPWTWAKGQFEEGGLFSFKVKRQVSETNVFAVGSVCIGGVRVEP